VSAAAALQAYASGCSAVFFVASLKAGAHWKLADEEARKLGKAVQGAIKSMDPKTKARMDNMIAKGAPLAALAAVAYEIVLPRVIQTSMIQASNIPAFTAVPPAGSSAPANGLDFSSMLVGDLRE
jgi:hypothetical protein